MLRRLGTRKNVKKCHRLLCADRHPRFDRSLKCNRWSPKAVRKTDGEHVGFVSDDRRRVTDFRSNNSIRFATTTFGTSNDASRHDYVRRRSRRCDTRSRQSPPTPENISRSSVVRLFKCTNVTNGARGIFRTGSTRR